ncbi:S8 family serine peptidase [Streptomyces sp. DSM 44917]|uniref:S8 family serine peptidase n=1 Tax=Streptomyces boetiae TaxID=3075541 RepID=A0ABU2L9Z7_9ACTN|nr:S8 family serine peptidase [Streptomyces sp. DSM 44917]MDT0308395.1 S8 family serine peptidase [Streptomyces sp. DSM 44917]
MNPAAGDGARRPGETASMADAGIQKSSDQYTDKFLVLLDPEAQERGMAALRSSAGIAPAERIRSAGAESTAEILDQAGAVILEDLGVGIAAVEPDQRQAMMATAQDNSSILTVERERIVYASQRTLAPGEAATADYLRGFQDGVGELVAHTLQRMEATLTPEAAAAAFDERRAAWSVQAIRALESRFTGQGVKVAVLDTGVDTDHPDLAGRIDGTASFVPGETVEDTHGHGTHCIGSACGPISPRSTPRYGVAGGARILAAKVLDRRGRGGDAGILQAMNWAASQGCRVISMSLGMPVPEGTPHSRVFEQVARRLLRAGVLIVAAAGNESERPGLVAPVGHPANCPSIMAVGSIGRTLEPSSFTCGGQVDIAAPGEDICSAAPGGGYTLMDGTSMATPHVAGVIALLAEAHPQATAAELKSLLLAEARRLPLPATDVGAGLLQAP